MKLSKPITELLDSNNIEWDYAPKEAVEKSISQIKEMMERIGFECDYEESCTAHSHNAKENIKRLEKEREQ